MKTIFAYGKERKVCLNNGYECFAIPAKDSTTGKKNLMYVHRWIWMQTFGEIPKGMNIHHKDENKLNNSLENLEMISHAAHLSLHKTGSKAKYKGGCVCWHKTAQKWWVAISQDGKQKHLGLFSSKLEGYQALFEYDKVYWTLEKQQEVLLCLEAK
jgi:hypothetical protein